MKNIIFQNKFGYIKGYFGKDGYWFIEEFFILKKFRGKGHARSLAIHIPRKSKLLAYPLFNSGKCLNQKDLIGFYQSVGFEIFKDSYENTIMKRG